MQLSNSTCVRCGQAIQGYYCSYCGEKRLEEKDKSLIHFFEELVSSIFVADGKFLQTIKLLVSNPGELVRSFVLGIRKKYLSPLQVFFFANLIYFIFPLISTFNTNLEIQMYHLPYSAQVRDVVEDYLESSGLSTDIFKVEFEKTSSSNAKLLLIVLVLLQGLFLKLLYLKNKKLFLIDFFAGSAYFYGFYILIILVLFPASLNFISSLFGVGMESMINELNMTVLFLLIIFIICFLSSEGVIKQI